MEFGAGGEKPFHACFHTLISSHVAAGCSKEMQIKDEDLSIEAAKLHELKLVAYRMHLRLESEVRLGDLEKERKIRIGSSGSGGVSIAPTMGIFTALNTNTKPSHDSFRQSTVCSAMLATFHGLRSSLFGALMV
jgi:hypothetical protein